MKGGIISGQLFSGIKSIQTGAVSMLDNATSGTATITSVDLNNAILIPGGFNTAGAGAWSTYNPNQLLAAIELTNATTVTARKQGSFGTGTTALSFAFTVVEFYPGAIKSIQSGVTNISAVQVTNTSTITSVDTTKAFIISFGCTNNGAPTDDPREVFSKVVLTNATTVTASKNADIGAISVNQYWMVVEFY